MKPVFANTSYCIAVPSEEDAYQDVANRIIVRVANHERNRLVPRRAARG